MVKPIFPALAPGGVPHPYCQDGHLCLRMRPAHWCQPEGGQLSIPAGFVGSDRQIEAVWSCSERPSSSRVPRPTCSTTEIVPLRLHWACGLSARPRHCDHASSASCVLKLFHSCRFFGALVQQVSLALRACWPPVHLRCSSTYPDLGSGARLESVPSAFGPPTWAYRGVAEKRHDCGKTIPR